MHGQNHIKVNKGVSHILTFRQCVSKMLLFTYIKTDDNFFSVLLI